MSKETQKSCLNCLYNIGSNGEVDPDKERSKYYLVFLKKKNSPTDKWRDEFPHCGRCWNNFRGHEFVTIIENAKKNTK